MSIRRQSASVLATQTIVPALLPAVGTTGSQAPGAALRNVTWIELGNTIWMRSFVTENSGRAMPAGSSYAVRESKLLRQLRTKRL